MPQAKEIKESVNKQSKDNIICHLKVSHLNIICYLNTFLDNLYNFFFYINKIVLFWCCDNLNIICISLNLFIITNLTEIYNFIVKNKSWSLTMLKTQSFG